MRALPWGLVCILLALNLVQLVRRPAAAPAMRDEHRQPAPAASDRPSSPRPPVTFAPLFAPSPEAAAPPRFARDGGAKSGGAIVDDALIQDVLCTISEQQMRDHWRGDREGITRGLRRSLADPAEQEADLTRGASEMSALLELSAAARDELTRRYRERRDARVSEARAAVDQTPPDYDAFLAAAQGLYADEDALARELSGDAGLERLRAGKLEERTTILAIAAALSGAPDRAIRW